MLRAQRGPDIQSDPDGAMAADCILKWGAKLGIYQAEVRHLIQQIHLQIMMELDMLMTNPLLVAGANDNLR